MKMLRYFFMAVTTFLLASIAFGNTHVFTDKSPPTIDHAVSFEMLSAEILFVEVAANSTAEMVSKANLCDTRISNITDSLFIPVFGDFDVGWLGIVSSEDQRRDSDDNIAVLKYMNPLIPRSRSLFVGSTIRKTMRHRG